MFRGIFTALVTPFKNGRVDEDAYWNMISRQIDAGIHGIVPTGTTGEASTLSFAEHYRVIELAVEAVGGRVPVLAGVGANNTDEAMQNIREAQRLGVNGLLVVTPYYNRPTQKGLFEHYSSLADIATVPIVLYNVPGRTGVNLEPATVARLAKNRRIVGIKEASGSMRQVSDIIRLVDNPDFLVFSGDDSNNLPIYALGGQGAISVTANIMPDKVAALWQTWQSGNNGLARQLHYELEKLNQAMFIETNPIPVKTALAMMGLIEAEFRLPLCMMEPGSSNWDKLCQTLVQYGLV